MDIGQKQKQYHHQDVDCTFEHRDNGGMLREDKYVDGTEDAEAVIDVFIQRHCIECGYTDAYSQMVVKQDEQWGGVIVPSWDKKFFAFSHFISGSIGSPCRGSVSRFGAPFCVGCYPPKTLSG